MEILVKLQILEEAIKRDIELEEGTKALDTPIGIDDDGKDKNRESSSYGVPKSKLQCTEMLYTKINEELIAIQNILGLGLGSAPDEVIESPFDHKFKLYQMICEENEKTLASSPETSSLEK